MFVALLCFFISLFLFVVYLIFFWQWDKNQTSFYVEGEVLYIGHRGSPTLITENTLPSFQKAIDQGVDGLELDIRLSQDGKVIIFHDRDLKRLAGRKDKVNQLTLEQLQRIVLIKKEEQTAESQAPSFDDLVPLLDQIKVINIEIKSEKLFDKSTILYRLLDFIHNNKIKHKCIVSSFNPYLLTRLRIIDKEVLIGFLYSSYKNPVYNMIGILLCKPDSLHVNYKALNKQMVWWSKLKGLKINSYTINDKKGLKYARSFKIDGIFTDNIEYLK